MKSEPAKPKKGPSGSPNLILSEPARDIDRLESILIVHGLNLAPEKMGAWRDALLDLGFSVALLKLSGHGAGEAKKWSLSNAQSWLEDIGRARKVTQEKWPDYPVSLCGFSLGALAGMVWSLGEGNPWHRAILIAPAFRMKFYGPPLLRFLELVLPTGTLLPSMTPRNYRVHSTTPLSAYLAVLELCRRFAELISDLSPDQGNCRQFIVNSPRDEMISTRFLRDYQAQWGDLVDLQPISFEIFKRYPGHLIIDPISMGPENWQQTMGHLKSWLDTPLPEDKSI